MVKNWVTVFRAGYKGDQKFRRGRKEKQILKETPEDWMELKIRKDEKIWDETEVRKWWKDNFRDLYENFNNMSKVEWMLQMLVLKLKKIIK